MPIAKRDNDERDDRQQPQIFKNVENIIQNYKECSNNQNFNPNHDSNPYSYPYPYPNPNLNPNPI